jgi:small subunit ribosomal protein S2
MNVIFRNGKNKKNKNRQKKVSIPLRKKKPSVSLTDRVLQGRLKYRLLIDVQSTLSALKQSLSIIEEISKEGGDILVVGTRKEYKHLLFNYGRETGHPFFSRWVSGTLTNWLVFSDNVRKYGDRLNTLTLLDWQRKKLVTEFLRKYQGVVARPNKPSLVIFLNAQELSRPINEAFTSGVPSMGLLNTSGNPHSLTYPIPANDSSLKVVGLFLTLVKKAIKAGVKKRNIIAKKKNLIANKPTAKLTQLTQKNVKKARGNASQSRKNSNKPVKRKDVKNKKK